MFDAPQDDAVVGKKNYLEHTCVVESVRRRETEKFLWHVKVTFSTKRFSGSEIALYSHINFALINLLPLSMWIEELYSL
jgi:hypothetical protein